MLGRDPPQKLAHRAVLPGPYDQMPVVRHQLKREQLHVVACESFFKNALEGFVIGLFGKMRAPPVAAAYRAARFRHRLTIVGAMPASSKAQLKGSGTAIASNLDN